MNENNDFILLKKINIFNDYINEYIIPLIPSVHRDVRIHLLDETYELLKYLYEAIYNKGILEANALLKW